MSAAVSPCVYPRCDDGTGNATLTRHVICRHCRNRYRRLITWIAEDYTVLRTQLPKPTATAHAARHGKTTSFGHPAAWASDLAADIADILTAIESNLREHNGHAPTRAERLDAAGARAAEAGKVAEAITYLHARFDDLCEFPDAEDCALELTELHRQMRAGLGITHMGERLDGIRCPNPQCDQFRLIRTTGEVLCQACGVTFPESDYKRLALILASDVLAERDRRCAEWVARRQALA